MPGTHSTSTVMLAKTILALCLAHFASALSSNSTQEPPCPDGWLRLFNSCYLFETMKLSFDMAVTNCVVKGGKIFVPNSAVEWKEVVKNAPAERWSWVGLRREGAYMPRWTENGGVNVAEIDWLVNPGTPEMNGWSASTQCLACYNSPRGRLRYAFFYYCGTKHYSICKKRVVLPPK
ncbi:hypothetical protein OSTOST_17853 [Ostertagia ostertagi]